MRACLFFLIFSCFLVGQESEETPYIHIPPKISLKVDELEAFEGKPIPLSITITHLYQDVIDTSSFRLDDQPLAVKEISTTQVGPSFLFKSRDPDTLYVSRYKAFLESRPAGVYTVGPVFVRMSGSLYQSGTILFNVNEAVVSPSFTVQSQIDAPRALYPGQKVGVTYRISFQDRVQILHERLPLLELEGFSPMGAPVSEIVSIGGDQYVETIHRDFRAASSGTFVFEPSVIEGMKYLMQGGERVLLPPLFRAKEEGKELTVFPFPEKGKPSFFRGALGSFTWRGRIVGSNKVEMKDTLEVEWRVSGRGDIDTVALPSLSEDPAFASRFLIEGEPKETKEDEGTRSYRVFLRPKKESVTEVPAFWFASFDPSSQTYITSLTQPLSLEIVKKEEKTSEEGGRKASSLPLLLFDPLLYKNTPEEGPLTLAIVWYASLAFLLAGFVEKKMVERRVFVQQSRKSRDLFYEAFAKRTRKQEGLKLLKEALLLRLFETALIQTMDQSIASLSNEGLIGEVKHTLQDIDMHLYGHQKEVHPIQKIWEEAAMLFQAMKSMKEKQ